LLKLLNRAIKQHFSVNRPFITIVVGPDGQAQVHSNMDRNSERVQLLTQVRDHLRTMQ